MCAHTAHNVHAHTCARACTPPPGITFNALIVKLEAPRGRLERLIQPVSLRAVLFVFLSRMSKGPVFLADWRVAGCFAFWLQLVNFSEPVDPGVRRGVFPSAGSSPGGSGAS